MKRSLAAWVAGLAVWSVALGGLALIDGGTRSADLFMIEEPTIAAVRGDTIEPFVLALPPEQHPAASGVAYTMETADGLDTSNRATSAGHHSDLVVQF